MGMSISCPFASIDDLDTQFESILVRSLSFGSDDVRSALQSVNLNRQESSPDVMKSFGSGKMIVEGPVSFKRRELKTMSSFKPASLFMDKSVNTQPVNNNHKGREVPDQSPTTDSMPLSNPHKQRYHAALKLQKTYKSFRTRRQLADCAVLVEQRWWKLLDFAELKHNSISFFDIEKPETAISRWSRAKNRAAKVGKGLSKDEKARKLALQHWLEAIDPRHRYGHNLQFYYAKWLHCESRQPFFYWLDIGEGKEVSLERCHRTKLQQQCIKYLGPTERKAYEVKLEEGKFVYKQSGKLLDTREGPEEAKWIFVLGVCKTLYVGLKQKGTFQHSSFLAGGATLSAGRLEVEDGILKAVWPHSGHYLPTKENFEAFITFLTENGVDLSNVQKNYKVEEEGAARVEKAISIRLRNSISVPDFIRVPEETNAMSLNQENSVSRKQYCDDIENLHPPSSRWSKELRSKMLKLEISRREDVFKMLAEEGVSCSIQSVDEESEGYETAEEYLSDIEFSVSKQNLFGEGDEEEEEHVPKEKIIHRINSHKGMKSYQLAQHLSCRWTTGAGPRIGCVRDYPSELQFRALEEVQLSPRSALARHRSVFSSPEVMAPATLCRIKCKSPLGMQQTTCQAAATKSER